LVLGAPGLDDGTGAAYAVFGRQMSPPVLPVPPGFSFLPPEPNHAPVAGDDYYTTPWNQPLTIPGPGLLANDTDEDGDPLTVSGAVSTTQHGVRAWSADGGFTYTLNV